jgi:serine/threonine protein kinase
MEARSDEGMELVLRYLELAGETGAPLRLDDFDHLLDKLHIRRGGPEHFVLVWSDFQIRRDRGELCTLEDLIAAYPMWADKIRGMNQLSGYLRGMNSMGRLKMEQTLFKKGWAIDHVLKEGKRYLTCLAKQDTDPEADSSRPVVLKAGFGASSIRQLKREYLLGRTLNPDFFVRPLTIEALDNVAWITMELAPGGSLDVAPMKDHQEIHHLWLQLSRGLAYLHDRMICHNDIKASNILLDSHNGQVRGRLADLQLATREGKAVNRHRSIWDHPTWDGGDISRRRDDVYRLAMTVAWLLDPVIAKPDNNSTRARLDCVARMPEAFRQPLSLCLKDDPLERIDNGLELHRLLKGSSEFCLTEKDGKSEPRAKST